MFQLIVDGSLGGSGGVINVKKRVKVEGSVTSWVEPMYGTPPNIIFDGNNPLFNIEFF
jgi:hypothetical protein